MNSKAVGSAVATDSAGTRPRAFEDFYEREAERLIRGLAVITGNVAEAEDIAQDAFLRVYERWDAIGRMEEPAGYLHRTAMNVFRSQYRRTSVALRRRAGLVPESDVFSPVDDRDVAVRMLARLTPRQRAALVLTAAFGYSGEEAARMLGVAARTVWVLTHQARNALATTPEDRDD